MKSRKLRALALVLSAIMIITAVPSTLFAEDFVGEVDGWDDTEITEAEAPAEFDLGFGADFVAEAEVEAPVVEEFEAFASDDIVAGVMDITEEYWDEATMKVTVKFSDLGSEVADMTRLEYKDDCTKYYYGATVQHLGQSFEIYSTSDQNKSGTLIGTRKFYDKYGLDVTFDGAEGLYTDSTKSHKWDDGTPYNMNFACTQNTYQLEYTCLNCGKLGYMAASATTVTAAPDDTAAAASAKTNAKVITTTGTGHIKPSDSSLITVTNIITSTALAAENANTDNITGKTVSALVADNKLKADNVKAGTEKAPEIDDSTDDCYWVEKNAWKCTKCGAQVYEYEQKSIMVRKIVYGFVATAAGDNVQLISGKTLAAPTGLTASDFGLSSTSAVIYAGTDYDTDKANFEIIDCSKNGKIVEYWYTTEGEDEDGIKITHTIEHTVDRHTPNKTVYASAAVKVGDTSTGDSVTDLKKLYKLNSKNVPVMSLSCLPAKYYEIVICQCSNHMNRVLSCTEKVVPGNEDAHQYNADINTLVKDNKVLNVAKKKFVDDNTLYPDIRALEEAFASKTTVNFKNQTYTCTKDGTVDVSYTCAICKKEIELGTFSVKAPDHVWTWVDIEPKKDATCLEDGYVTQQSQCKYCSTVNTALEVRKAVVPKLNHKGIDKVTVYYLSVADGGDIIDDIEDGPMYVGGDLVQGKTTEDQSDLVNNYSVVNARVYKICPICGLPVYDSDLETSGIQAFPKANIKYAVTKLDATTKSCNNGTIEVTVTCDYPGKTGEKLTATGTYDYWRNNNAYQARTQHAPKENADGSVVCVICGKVIKEAPVVTTVAPTTVEPTTVVTTEAPTTVAPTTAAPTTTAPTTEAPVVPTTVAPVTVEPTTEITTVEPATMPAQVTGEKVTKNSPANGIIGVKYNAVDGADSYTVNVREPNGSWTKNPTNGAETAYDITGLTEGKCYDIRIAAVAAGIAGPRSGHLYRWLKKVTLMKPTKIKDEAGAVNVTWDAADGATKYKLYVSADKTFKTGVQKIKVVENTAKVTGLQAGTKYYFKVRCYTKAADGKTYTGGWSNVKSKTLK